jgi:hypothetical protein
MESRDLTPKVDDNGKCKLLPTIAGDSRDARRFPVPRVARRNFLPSVRALCWKKWFEKKALTELRCGLVMLWSIKINLKKH